MEIQEKTFAIRYWSPQDKPREKLLSKGRASLSDAELVAILLGTGTRTLSAVDLGKRLLQAYDYDLNALARLSVKDLQQIKGIGQAKAIAIIAAFELGRRRSKNSDEKRPHVRNSRDAFEIIQTELQDIDHEEFWVIMLNRANRVIDKQRIGIGGVSGTVADPRIIFKAAIQQLASGIILVHNHPSGNLTPSLADIELTKKIKEAGKLLDIQVPDHLILGGQNYFSFADEGML